MTGKILFILLLAVSLSPETLATIDAIKSILDKFLHVDEPAPQAPQPTAALVIQEQPQYVRPPAYGPIYVNQLPLKIQPQQKTQYIPRPPFPCKGYTNLKRINSGDLGNEIRVPWDYSTKFQLKVKFVFARLLPENEYDVKLKMVQPYDQIASDGLRYSVTYSNQLVIPKITEISANGQVLCQGPPEKPLEDGPYERGTTTLTVTHTTYGIQGNQQQ